MSIVDLPQFVVFGEALTDFIREDHDRWYARPGGACWNVARVAAKLGTSTGWGGAVSQDLFGEDLKNLALAAGLDARFIQQRNRPPLLAIVPDIHPPHYFFIGADSADLYFDPTELPKGWMASARMLHFGCISLVREPLAQRLVAIAQEAALAGKTILFDPNMRSVMSTPKYKVTFQTLCTIAHHIKVSDEDLREIFPGEETSQALAALRQLSPQADILLTQGSQGMTLFTQDGQIFKQSAFRVTVADTVGCGDAAMGGWASSLLAQPLASPAHHIQQAAATAAVVAQHSGAYAPSAQEVAHCLKQAKLLD